MIHRLKNHGVLDFDQDILKCGNILISELGERHIHKCEGVCPLLRLLINKLKLNHNDVVLEFGLTLCDLLLNFFDLSLIPRLLNNRFLN